METGDKKVCDVIASSPDAEDVLENAGVDYWFGWDRKLGQACEAANVDPDELASRLVSGRPCAHSEPRPAKLAALLKESDAQWIQRIAPSIAAAVAAARLRKERGDGAARLLNELEIHFEQHMATSESLMPMADSIEHGEAGIVGLVTLRTLRLEHLEFARIASGLRAEAERLGADADVAELVAAMRTVIREIHRHIRVAHNFILPRLVAAATTRPVAFEPW
jgi:iron-sulfur cluster repair protein YtfE (RIC family)